MLCLSATTFRFTFSSLFTHTHTRAQVFAEHSAKSIPKLLLCTSQSGAGGSASGSAFFQNTDAQKLTSEGNDLAVKIKSKFIVATDRHKKETEFYRTFFTDAWVNKTNTEAVHRLVDWLPKLCARLPDSSRLLNNVRALQKRILFWLIETQTCCDGNNSFT